VTAGVALPRASTEKPRDSRRGALLSPEEFAAVLGRKPEAKLEMVLVDGELYSRQSAGHWWRHPPYPALDAVCP
jgi:hypothetical protein